MQHRRAELDAGERLAGAAERLLAVGGAVAVVEHRARGAPPGDQPQVRDGGGAAKPSVPWRPGRTGRAAAAGRARRAGAGDAGPSPQRKPISPAVAASERGCARPARTPPTPRTARRLAVRSEDSPCRNETRRAGMRLAVPEMTTRRAGNDLRGRGRRASSKAATAPALATPNDSTPACMGMASSPASSGRTDADRPFVSFPSTSATRGGQLRREQRGPARVQPVDREPGVGQRRAALLDGGRPQHRRPERHPGRRLDHQRVDRGQAATGEQHAVEPGRGGAAQDHADVRRVGEPVQHEHPGRAGPQCGRGTRRPAPSGARRRRPARPGRAARCPRAPSPGARWPAPPAPPAHGRRRGSPAPARRAGSPRGSPCPPAAPCRPTPPTRACGRRP